MESVNISGLTISGNVNLSATTGGTTETIKIGKLEPAIYQGGDPNLQDVTKNYTPTESAQSEAITASQDYDGLGTVTVNVGAISSSYVGSGITRRSSTDLSASGATVTAPAGYYSSNATKSVQAGSATTPATTITANPSISVGSDGKITATVNKSQNVTPTVSAGYVSSGTAGAIGVTGSATSQLSTQAGKTVTPTESEQTAVASGKYTTGAVKVGAISSTYVGSGITQRSSSDLSASGDTVSVPSGYYSSNASKSVATGTAGTPTATKVVDTSEAAALITPSVTNTTGYITGGTKTGTAFYVTAGELVAGNSATADEAGSWSVDDLETLVIPAGTAGTPSASKSISNHAATVTPSVTNSAGWINSGTKTGTAVNVSASELVSGTLNVSSNGQKDVTNYQYANVQVPSSDTTLVVTLDWDDDYFGQGSGAWVPDCTYSDITAAYQAGKAIVVKTAGDDALADGWYYTGEGFSYGASVWDDDGLHTTYSLLNNNGIAVEESYITVIPEIGDFTTYIDTPSFVTENNQRKWKIRPGVSVVDAGYLGEGWYGNYSTYNAVPANTTITPTESAQTIGGANYMMEGAVTVNAISSSYVGSGITRRSSSDLTESSGTITAPAGYYSSDASKAVSAMTLPTATSSSSSGTRKLTVDASTSGTRYINIPTGYNSAAAYYQINAVATGSAGTPTASKGTVSNHSISVTPSVTNTTGYITGGTKTGTAVTVQASELVSGNLAITQNGNNIDCSTYSTVSVNVSGGGGGGLSVSTATATPSSAGASISFTGLTAEPTSFYVISNANLATGASPYKTAAVVFDGTNLHGQIVTNTSNANASYDTNFSKSYSNGTLTITGTGAYFQANQYTLVYTSGGSSANIGAADVQVGSGATSITFTDLPEEPTCWSCIFKSNFGTSSGYQRVIAVVNDGSSTYGLEMDSEAKAASHWTANYSNGSLTISSNGTNQGGYWHQPGYYQLTYAVGGTIEITTEPLSVTENGTYTAPSGKAYTPVTVNVSGGSGWAIDSKTISNSSNTATSISFTNMKGQPRAFFLRCTTQMQSSSTTYYYVSNMRYNGTNTEGNAFRMGSTRQVTVVTSGYSFSYSGTTLTLSSSGSRTTAPGSFYNGNFELTYIY